MMMKKKKKNPSSKSKDECMNKEMDKIVVNMSGVYHISEDLIIEILLRLPPISVLRFKQVCKTWYFLISNPDFLRTHSSYLQFHKHSSSDEEMMVSSYLSKIIPLKVLSTKHPLLKQTVKFPKELLHCYAINSCNGLLLLCSKPGNSFSFLAGKEAGIYYVCNPITKHYVKIPNISIIPKYFNGKELKISYLTYYHPPYLLFDPSTSLSYKLIRCLCRRTENGDIFGEFYVYSSKTGSWSLLASFPYHSLYHIPADPAVLLNGILYWNAYTGGDHLLCFDLKNENVWFLPLPPKPMGYGTQKCFYFGKCDGRLRLIGTSMNQLTFPCSFDILETEQQQQQQDGRNLKWSVKYHVNIETGYDHLIKNLCFTFRIIQLYKTKNKGEEEALLLNIHGKIVPFNLKSNTFGKALTELTIENSIYTPSSDFSNVFPHITTTLFPLL